MGGTFVPPPASSYQGQDPGWQSPATAAPNANGFTPPPPASYQGQDPGMVNDVTATIPDPAAIKAFEQSPGIPVYQLPRTAQEQGQQPPDWTKTTPQWVQDISDLPRQAVSGLYSAGATASHLVSNLFHLLGAGADIMAPNSLEQKLGIYKAIENWAQQQQQGAQQTSTTLAGKDQDPISNLYRNAATSVFNIPTYSVAAELGGPVLGMAGLGALETADQGPKAAMMGALQGGLQGGVMHVLGPGNRAVRFLGNASSSFANDVFNGVDPKTAFWNAMTVGGMSAIPGGGGGFRDIGQNLLPEQGLPVLPPLFRNRNPLERAAINYLRQQKIPVDLGTAAGGWAGRGLTGVVDTSPFGMLVKEDAAAKTTEALQRHAGELVAGATPEVSPNELYQQFYDAENAPSSTRRVPAGGIDEKGKPVMQDMQMPVPVGLLKPKIKPLLDQMQWMPITDRNSSAGYTALQRIWNGPDYIPASQAETGLSGIKNMIRTGEGRNQGLAKFIAPQLQSMIDRAVQDVGGDDAMAALQKGRIAAAQQAGAEWLKEGFDKAMAEGGYGRTGTLFNRWTNLPIESKRTMFTPKQVSDLDKFFLGAKKLAENINPSGTARVVSLGAQLASGLTSPHFGLAANWATTGALAKLVHSEKGVRLLTEGLRVGANSPRGKQIIKEINEITTAKEP